MSTTTEAPSSTRLAYRVEEAAELMAISRSALYELIRSKQIATVTIGRSRRITRQALTAYLEGREAA